MTETHLSTLLRESATDLAVPDAPTRAIVSSARRAHRRRRTALAGAAALAALAVVGSGVAIGHLGADGAQPTPAHAPGDDGWAVAQGSTIHLGTGATAKVPGKVKAMYYTSAGTLVRVGKSPYTDAPDSNYWLVRPDGATVDFTLDLGDRVPGSDPTLPYLAYADKDGDSSHWDVVLRDVRTGKVAASIPITGTFSWGGWVAPPVALSGDHVYVGLDDATLEVDWRTGDVRTATGLEASDMPETRGGRDITGGRGSFHVVDAHTGKVLLDLASSDEDVWPQLSPDGKYVLLTPTATCEENGGCHYDEPETAVYDVTTHARHTVRLTYGEFGWTSRGRLLEVDHTAVKSCTIATGECTTTGVRLDGSGPIRISGNGNES